jgi:hypothetical protein
VAVLVEILIWIFAEVVIELVVEGLVKGGARIFPNRFHRVTAGSVTFIVVFGALAGALSTFIWAPQWQGWTSVLIATLAVLACGSVMGAIGAAKRRRSREADFVESFAIGGLLAATVAGARVLVLAVAG